MTKFFVLLSLIGFLLIKPSLPTSAQLPNTWTQKNNFGGLARFGAASFSIGDKGYLGTGSTGANRKDFWEYNPTTDSWTQKANFGGTARMYATGFSISEKGYIACGEDGSYKNDLWEYSPVTNSWLQKADFPGAPRVGAVSFSIGAKGYLGIGLLVFGPPAIRINDFWEYDQATDVWTQKSNIGTYVRAFGVGFSIGNKGYIGTGNNGSTLTKDFWEYDPATDIWIRKADLGGAGRFQAVGISTNEYGYISLGDIGGGYTNDFWEYSPTVNTWTKKTDFGGPVCTLATGFSISNKVFVGTGYNAITSTKYNDFWEYTSTCNPIVITSEPGNQSITFGESASFNVIATGVISYQWQEDAGSGFVDIVDGGIYSNAKTATLSLSSPGVSMIGYKYRCILTENCLNTTATNGNATLILLDVSIKDINMDLFEIYPNPSKGILNIKVKTASKEAYNIEIYNNLGAIIWEQQNIIMDGNNNKSIALNSYPSGLYTIVLRTKTNSYLKKVLIAN